MTNKILSFDVWDTLLRRKCHPDIVKLYVGKYLLLYFYNDINLNYKNPWIILKERQRIEGVLALASKNNKLDDEYHIDDVIEALLCQIFIDKDKVSTEHIKKIVDFEIKQEIFVSYPDSSIKKTIEEIEHSRKIFISDFYMKSDVLALIIEQVYGEKLLDAGYSSCDYFLNKRSGNLFPIVLNEEKRIAADFYHLGDNFHSDVKMPRSKGMHADHFLPVYENSLRMIKDESFNKRNEFIEKKLISKNINNKNIEEYASDTACLFISYVIFIAEYISRNNYEKVFFFTREGEFFLKIYKLLQLSENFPFKLIDAELLEVSRVATFGPSLKEFTLTELMRVWNLYGTQSMAALFKTIDVDIKDFIKFFDKYNLNINEKIKYPWLDKNVIDIFSDSNFVEEVEAALKIKRDKLLNYLSNKGLNESSRKVAIIDIGWRGTIQDNIASIFKNCHFDGFYLGLAKFLNTQPENCSKIAFGPNLNLNQEFTHLLNILAPIEMLCNSPNGSVKAYHDSGVPIKLIDDRENLIHDKFISKYQIKVLDEVPKLLEFYRINGLDSQEVRNACLQVWEQIIEKPNSTVAKAYFQLNHNEEFGVGGFQDKSKIIDFSVWIKALVSLKGLKKLIAELENIGWPQGYLSARKIGFLWAFINGLKKIKLKINSWS